MIEQYLTVFLLMVALDFVWARYTLAIQRRAHVCAAATAGVIFLLNGVVTVAYVGDYWVLLPAIAGAVVGTYIGSRFVK